jgi:hypothetical protein
MILSLSVSVFVLENLISSSPQIMFTSVRQAADLFMETSMTNLKVWSTPQFSSSKQFSVEYPAPFLSYCDDQAVSSISRTIALLNWNQLRHINGLHTKQPWLAVGDLQ